MRLPDNDSGDRFVIPELCNAKALSVLVLVGQLLVLVLLFAGGGVSWIRMALMSLFVQWVSLTSAGILCSAKPYLGRLGVVRGAIGAFALIELVTLGVGLVSDRVLVGAIRGVPVDWAAIAGQMLIAGIIAGAALRYVHVQQQLKQREQAELQSRIQALQSRIRPHFLFNSMNIIASLIATDPDTAEAVVEDLAELFRASLNDAGNEVTLTDELALCQRYVRIEQLRLGDRLEIEWRLPEEMRGARVPLLTLQPLLENAIYHGVQPIPEGGKITVQARSNDGNVTIRITNPIPPPNAKLDGAGRGNRMAISNIRGRLAALYGDRASLSTHRQDGRFVTELTLPGPAREANGR